MEKDSSNLLEVLKAELSFIERADTADQSGLRGCRPPSFRILRRASTLAIPIGAALALSASY